ncbi:MAG: glycosyltransferase family 4 protein [Anaerolineae bacterium]|nr:glycosyltransferase family 4 protein [Anaerolineae bacterium]
MRICYVMLSPTFGMHQYTADIANRMAGAGHDVHLITTRLVPHDRYAPAVNLHTPVEMSTTGFSPEALRFSALREVRSAIYDLHPDVVHFTGPHLWNVPLVRALVAQGIPVVHTLHDLDPHRGVRFGFLIRFWNRLIVGSADHILVHGQTYRQRLLAWGVSPERVTWSPLLHLFLGNTRLEKASNMAESVRYEPWALFFGRLEHYKGIDHLIAACAMMDKGETTAPRLVIAGRGDMSALWVGSLPNEVVVHNRLIDDEEAIDLFCRCGVLVLPYVDATQSALIAAAYYFRKPVIVARSGALPEYVEDGRTGYVVEPGHPAALARCLEMVLNDPTQLARMGAAGRAWYDVHRADEERSLGRMYLNLASERRVDSFVVQSPQDSLKHPSEIT